MADFTQEELNNAIKGRYGIKDGYGNSIETRDDIGFAILETKKVKEDGKYFSTDEIVGQ